MDRLAPLERSTTALLFTDIVGSTQRWERDRDAMESALARHDAILRTLIERHGGRVFKTVGDAFCAAFEQPREALNASVEAQRRLQSEDFQAVGGLPVRMALHCGETQQRDDDFFGPAVNRVARLLAAGSGGQILVSGAFADAVIAGLQADASLRSLGTLPMRGIADPERVLEVVVDGLPDQFPPLRSIETPPNNLPRQTTKLVGRFEDIRRVEELAKRGPLTTIVGTGGIGKTRIALAVAFGLLADTRDGVWFVDLSSLADPELVAGAIGSALGVDPSGEGTPRELLIVALRSRELVLVLDNCEHLLDGVARIVGDVLTSCPRVVVLATSREPLNVPGERLHRVSALSDEEAVALFAERAMAVDQRFVLDASNRPEVAALCRRMDGIALAIELAAARMRSMTLNDLSRRLHLRALTGGARTGQPRQQTMRALIGWSYDLLNASERELFRRAGAFAGGFDLDVASEVCAAGDDDDWELLDRLESLADKSLLIAEGEERTRYRLLEPLREFARERLDADGETAAVCERHAGAFAGVAGRLYERWDTDPQPDWVALAAPDLDNFRAAMDWSLSDGRDPAFGARIAGGVSPLFLRLSLLQEGIDWGERALARTIRPDESARIWYGLSMLQHNHGNNAAALQAARRAVEAYRQAGDERGLTRALAQVAHHEDPSGSQALEIARTALSKARALDDARLLANTLQRCAFVFPPTSMASARAYFEESVALFRGLGRPDETARALSGWADAESVAGNYAAAARIAGEALEIAGDDAAPFVNNVLAGCYVALGDRVQALPAARRALGDAVRLAHPVALPCAILYLAWLGADRDPSEAACLIGFARQRLRAAGWTLVDPDRTILEGLVVRLSSQLGEAAWSDRIAQGASWTAEQAAARALRA